ncbi:MAG: hypothetical protein RDV41_02755 [Planctomycetota bacterium]|nr:hypothetical protein [Planctomycetota bacterium]
MNDAGESTRRHEILTLALVVLALELLAGTVRGYLPRRFQPVATPTQEAGLATVLTWTGGLRALQLAAVIAYVAAHRSGTGLIGLPRDRFRAGLAWG